MGAKVYHFCQHERKTLYLPSHNKYKPLPVGTVLTECPSCGKPMKPVTIVGSHQGHLKRTGWRMKSSENYKKKQQAKSKAGNLRPVRYGRRRLATHFF
jgi:hypothetical protein